MSSSEDDDVPLGLRPLRELDRVEVRCAGGAGGAGGTGCAGGAGGAQYAVVAGGAGGGAALLTAREQEPLLRRVLAGRGRAVRIDVLDAEGREVMKVRRRRALAGEGLELALAMRGAAAGTVRQELTLRRPVLRVLDAAGRALYRLKGTAGAAPDCHFHLFTMQKERIGAISRRAGGAGGGEHFALQFPRELDTRHKAALIAACFLIDLLIYEN